MQQDQIFPPGILQPGEAATLHEATLKAIALIGAATLRDDQRQRVAGDVMRLAKSGYTRTADGTLDAVSLAEAAALRFRSFADNDGNRETERIRARSSQMDSSD